MIGKSVPNVVYRAVYAELNARYQCQAELMGEVTYLTEGESKATLDSVEKQATRAWNLWKRQVGA